MTSVDSKFSKIVVAIVPFSSFLPATQVIEEHRGEILDTEETPTGRTVMFIEVPFSQDGDFADASTQSLSLMKSLKNIRGVIALGGDNTPKGRQNLRDTLNRGLAQGRF